MFFIKTFAMLSIFDIKKHWIENADFMAVEIPAVIGNEELKDGKQYQIFDHNRPKEQKIVANYYSATKSNIDKAVEIALHDNSWRTLSSEQRIEIIQRLPAEMQKNYNKLVGSVMVNTGKLPHLIEGEIRKVTEFVSFYTESYNKLIEQAQSEVEIKAKGVGLVISPWNYPIALPGGSIIASLIAGNNVIFKPSNLSVLGSYAFAECFWSIGIPRSALQFLPIEDRETSEYLTKKIGINYIFFVGSTQVALSIIKNRPNVYIAAETGGKNVMMVTKTADKDQVIKDIIQSCFMNAGQVCSSTSIVVMVKEVYNDKEFMSKLANSVKNIRVAHAWDETSQMCAIIRKPTGDTLFGLVSLEDGEEWLVKPEQLDDTGILWSPGIRIGTKFGNKAHLTEFFAPTIAIMPVSDVDEGIEIANSTGYGLTSAIQSTDKLEQNKWIKNVKAGTISINKDTTLCSKVKAQPFGGFGKSAFGSGIKVGGYNYITQFLTYQDKNPKICDIHDIKDHNASCIIELAQNKDLEDFVVAAKSYLRWHKDYFSKEIDYGIIPNMQNITKFVKTKKIAVRIVESDDIQNAFARIFAAKLCSEEVYVSFDDVAFEIGAYSFHSSAKNTKSFKELLDEKYDLKGLFNDTNIVIELEKIESFIKKIDSFNRIRYSNINAVEKGVFEAASINGKYVITSDVLSFGRLELLNYLQEQTIVICN